MADRILPLDPAVVTQLRRAALLTAFVVIVLGYLAPRFGWLDYKPGGTAFIGPVRAAFLVLLGVSAVIALRFEMVGGVLAAFCAAILVTFAFNQLEFWHAVIVLIAAAVPGLLWIAIDLSDQPRPLAIAGLVAAAAAIAGGLFVGERIYDGIWGPTHPQSSATVDPDRAVLWMWSGAVDVDRVEIKAKSAVPAETVRLAFGTSPTLDDPEWLPAAERDGDIGTFRATGLSPETTYYYGLEVDGVLHTQQTGQVTTFPEGAASFRVALGGCARVGSNGRVFEAIAAADPMLYLVLGDLHYGDIPADDRARYDEVLDLTLSRPAQAEVYRTTPVAYVWDDHDYGANDSDGSSPSRQAAMDAYRAYVPSYELAGSSTPIYQAFTIGRVRFIMTDARSARSSADGLLGAEQRRWFENELVSSAASHAAVVWVNPVPWITQDEPGADHWGGFPDERRKIADLIAEHDIDNLVMASGDAHMVAIDDGTNSDFSTSGGAGFPVVHAAPLDRPGSIKGGPYSEGVIAEGGQFATIDVHDDGTTIDIELAAWNWRGDRLLHHRFSMPPFERDA